MVQGKKSRRKIWINRAVTALYAASVLLGSVPPVQASAQEADHICAKEEHIHGQHCAGAETVLVCSEETLDIHTHADTCRDAEGNLVCGKADTYIHEHTPVCFDGEELVCTLHYLPAHTHEATCYDENGQLTCDKEEAIPHTHGAGCYADENLICTSLELLVHTHTELCVETRMDCQIEEHTHTEACLPTVPDESIPETTGESIPETTSETTPETTGETVPETTAATVPETTPETQPQKLTSPAPRSTELASGSMGNNVTYTITQEGEDVVLTLKGTGHPHGYSNGNYPEWHEAYADTITKIVVEEGITELTTYIFAFCSKVSSVSLPSSLEVIDDNVFYYCESLTSIEIPENVTEIGNFAFCCSGLKSIVVPENVTTIGSSAFSYAPLESVVLPSKLTTISNWLFQYCRNLSQIEIPETVTTIGNSAFEECDQLKSIVIPASVTTVDGYAFEDTGLISAEFLGKNVKFGTGVFRDCGWLTNVTLPSEQEVISSDMFENCYRLAAIDLPDTVTEIGSWAFDDCAFTTIDLPDGITSIGTYAFSYTDLICVDLPNSLQTLGSNTFYKCKNLETVKISAELMSIGSNAFGGCEKFTNILVGTNVDALYPDVLALFKGRNVTFAGANTFRVDESLDPVLTFGGYENALHPGASYYADEHGALYRLEGDNATLCYIPAMESYDVPASVEAEGKIYPVTGIGKYTLRFAEGLEELTFADPDAITQIADFALADRPSLASVNGLTKVSQVKTLLGNAAFGIMALTNTALENDLGATEAPLVIHSASGGGATLMIENLGNFRNLTGEYVTHQVTVSNNTSENQIPRIFLHFSDSDGQILSHALGEQEYETEDGRTYTVTLEKTDAPNTWCFTFPSEPGDTLTFNFVTSYPSPTTDGGELLVWGSIDDMVSDEHIDTNGHHRVIWDVLESTTETIGRFYNYGNTIRIVGRGTAEDHANLENVGFILETEATPVSGEYGRNPLQSADYTVTITLPEGMRWNPVLLEAYNSGSCNETIYNTSMSFKAALNGSETRLLYVSAYHNSYNFSRPVFAENQVSFNMKQIRGTAALNQDLSGDVFWMYFGPYMIETVEKRPTAGTEFELMCQVSPVYHYRHSTVQGEVLSYTHTVAATRPNPTVYNTKNVSRPITGQSFVNTLEIRNTDTEDLKTMRTVDESLRTLLMVTPEDMDRMFADTYGEYLTFSITGMSVHNNSHLSTMTECQSLANTSYQSASTGMLPEAEGCLLSKDVELTVTRNTEGQVVVRVNAYRNTAGTTVAAAEYPVTGSIRDTFDSIGLLPDRDTVYHVAWNTDGKVILYSGQTQKYLIYATMKDEYSMLSEDALKTSGAFYNTWVDGYVRYGDPNNLSSTYGSLNIYPTPSSLTTSYYLSDLDVTDTVQQTGSVATLQISDGAKSADLYGHPLTALIRGGQVLLVDAEENPQLATLEGIRELTYEGKTWYLLDKPGTYENVYIGSDVAQSVIISDYAYAEGHDPELEAGQDGYLEYQINWHTETTATHDVMLLLLPSGECATAMYRTSAQVLANNHQGRRLYASSGMWHTFISAETDIVTQRGEEPQQDQLTDYLQVQKGGQVTYRVKLTGQLNELASQLDVAASFTGSTFYNILPSLAHRWTDEDVQMQWVYDEETVTVTNENSWIVENDTDKNGKCIDTIRWSDEFSMEFRGASEAYLYITVQFPEGEDWDETMETYDGSRLENRFIFFKPNTDGSDTVYHDLVEQAEALLVVGVNKTGIGEAYYNLDDSTDPANTDPNSRLIYSHSDYRSRLVQYYVTVYNDGNTRLYLEDIYLDLPDDFKVCFANYDVYSSRGDSSITDDSGRKVSRNGPYDDYDHDYSKNSILFEVDEYAKESLSYDSILAGYYLTPGQAFTIRFYATTGLRVDTDCIAKCVVAMPVRDPYGCGVEVGGSTVTGINYRNTIHNDGQCSLLTSAEAQEAGFTPTEDPSVSQWLFSSVTMTEQGIGQEQPDLSMTVADIDFRNEVGDGNYAQDSATITWAVTAHNYSGSAMYHYTIVDTIQRDYDFTGDVYATFTYGTRYIGAEDYTRRVNLFNISSLTPGKTETISTTGIGQMRVTYIPWSAEGEDMATISIQFLDAKGAIPDGGSCTLELSTKNTGANKNQTYINNAYIIPEGETWNEDTVVKGNVVTLDGVKAVQASSQVTVASHFATAASKTVTQTGEPENTATSKANAERIYIYTGEDKVNYTLSVSCFDMSAGSDVGGFQKLVLIDNLPEPGDHNTFDNAQPRYSDFKISLAPDAQITVSVKDKDGVITPLDADDYILQYSTETSFTEADWTGASDAKWTDNPTDARSFRIVLDREATGCCLDAGKTLLVNFEAVVDDKNASAGDTAWNSFGYYYTVNDSLSSTTREMKAEPMKVGVSFISTPVIQVDLVKPNGDAYEADADVTFSYVILEGELPETQTAAEDSLVDLLAGRTYTYADMTVVEGASQASRSLLNPLVYSYAEGVWQATDTPWEWKDGMTYTAIQLPIANEQDYEFQSIGGQSVNAYAFTYEGTQQTTIQAVNVRKLWNLDIKTVDVETRELLPGAWYGLYSPVQSQKLTGLLPAQVGQSVEREIVQNGVTYYLCAVAQGDENGTLLWEDLTELDYLVRQVRHPAGYHLNNEIFAVSRPADTYENTAELTVENITGYQLHNTGGMGTKPLMLLGITLMTLAAGAWAALYLRRKKTH